MDTCVVNVDEVEFVLEAEKVGYSVLHLKSGVEVEVWKEIGKVFDELRFT